MSAHYRYDGSFAGLLSVVAVLLEGGETPSGIGTQAPVQADLFAPAIAVATDAASAARVRAALHERHPEAERTAACAFLAATPGKDVAICGYLAQLLDPERSHRPAAALPAVTALAAEAHREAYRYKGLVRFRELADGLLYAPISPEHRVLPLLAPHFAARLGAERWLIHDVERAAAVAGVEGRWREGALALCAAELSARELECQRLWRRFFREVAIAERASAERQRRGLPLKVRRHLVELP